MCQWFGRKSQDDNGHFEEKTALPLLKDTEAATVWENVSIHNTELSISE